MVDRMLLCFLAIMALPLRYTNLVWAQQGGVSMIVVFDVQVAFDNLGEQYHPGERERRHPTA